MTLLYLLYSKRGFMERFKQLLDKKMDRRDFLLHVGALLLAVLGISALLRNLSDPHPIKRSSGYGSGKFEGASKKGLL